MRTCNLFILFFVAGFTTVAQFNPVKQAQAKFTRSKWREGRELLDKSIRKDSLRVQARFVYSKLFLNKRFDNYHVDSAYLFAQQTISLWNKLTLREKEKLRKFPIDSMLLLKLDRAIDSIAFGIAKEEDSEKSYIHFLEIYTKSPQRKLAVELRDEAAFVDALKQNTHSAFLEFLKKYPAGHRSPEARQRFERLLYAYATKGNTLKEFKQFVVDFPTSPYGNEAIAEIFKIETLGGEPETFERFIRQYPNTPSAKRAAALLIHLLSENERSIMNDSLKNIYPVKDWLPIHQQDGWGFIDTKGMVTLSGLPELNEEHFCKPLQTDYFLTAEGVTARNGNIIKRGKFDSVDAIGAGFLFTKQGEHSQLIHKSGWNFGVSQVQGARIIETRFLAIQRNERWALFSLTGQPLTEFVFQFIESADQFTLFNRAGKILLVSNDQILNFTNGQYQPIVADEIRPMGSRFLLRNGALEQIIDAQLNVIIPYARQQITFSALGLMVQQNNQISLPEWPPSPHPIESVTLAEPWAIIHAAGEKPSLHHIPSKKIIETNADSIWFDQSLVLTKRGDSTRLRLTNQQTITLPLIENITIKQVRDSTLFIIAKDKSKTRIIDANSLKELFRTELMVEPVLRDIFIFESKGKKGLLDGKGKVILPPTYDAIQYNQGTFALMKANLFGAFHPRTKRHIQPTFESNLRAIGKDAFIAMKKGKWGFLSSEGKPISNFEFEEIQQWSDSIALVKKNGGLALLKIDSHKLLLDSLDGLERSPTSDDSFTSIFERKGQYGLINGSCQIIIQPTLEELVPWEADHKALLLGLSVINKENRQVTFYSRSGKIIFTYPLQKELAYRLLCD